MASRKKNGAVAAAEPSPANGGRAQQKEQFLSGAKAHLNPENKNNWGYGRPSRPPKSHDVFAFEQCPWSLIAGLTVAFAATATHYTVGFGSLWALLTLPLFGLLFGLPALSVVLLPLSWRLDPAGPGCPEKYYQFNDAAFERKWRGQKIPIEELYEAYFDGKLDLVGGDAALLDTLYQRHEYSRSILTMSHAKFFLLQFIPELIKHTRFQDITQVREHYDRGNDFYNGFLGPSMCYTSGIWHDENDSLEQAQQNKMELIAQKMHLQKGEQHLDLGCGWGTFIRFCAKNYGTQSKGVTLSRNQLEWHKPLAKAEGVEKTAQMYCMDYRDTVSHEATRDIVYDKISCLEMSEHVGVKNYASFVQQVRSQLSDDGIFFLQIAGLRRAWQFEDFNWGLFMGKYVFPGADASCPLGWVINQLEAGGFEIRSEETIGIHYSATIRAWWQNWQRADVKREIVAKYGQRLYRVWNWFLAWAVISPEQGSASCYQIIAHKNTKRFDRKMFLAERKHYQI